jgi:hypothetical protein
LETRDVGPESLRTTPLEEPYAEAIGNDCTFASFVSRAKFKPSGLRIVDRTKGSDELSVLLVRDCCACLKIARSGTGTGLALPQ